MLYNIVITIVYFRCTRFLRSFESDVVAVGVVCASVAVVVGVATAFNALDGISAMNSIGVSARNLSNYLSI